MKKACVAFAGLAASLAACAAADGRAVECPTGVIEKVVRAMPVSDETGEFTVSLRFKFERYVKREGPWDGMVFCNGNGWDSGFRATVAPVTDRSPEGFRMGFRVVKAAGGGASVPVKGVLACERWYHAVFVLGGGELRSYLNGSLNAKCEFGGKFKKVNGSFFVGPAKYGVNYYPFSAKDVMVWERALNEDEVQALMTGGIVSPKEMKRFFDGLDEATFADMRSLAWKTAGRLVAEGERRLAAELYANLAVHVPPEPSMDGGNEAASRFAKTFGGIDAAPAVRWPEVVPFGGYPPYSNRVLCMDVSAATFVAPGGDDADGDGSSARPFASVGRALEAVRGRANKTILLKGGRYMLEKGISITAADSGSAETPLVLAAAPGETAILDGGRDVEGFAPCGLGEILVADLRGRGFAGMERPRCWGYGMSRKGSKCLLDLYEDEVPGNLARHPNEGFFATTWVDATNSIFKIDIPELDEWAKEPELMALTYMRWLWGDETTSLKIDVERGTMQIDTNLVKVVKKNHPVKLLNSLKALDEPGEWFLDHAAQKLYFWPRRKGARVTLSQLAEPIMSINGASFVEVRGLVMQNGRSAGIMAKNCEHVRIAGNEIRNLGSGMRLSGRDIVVSCNRLRSFSYGGISAYGGGRKTLAPSGIRILANDVSDIERKARTYCPCVHAEGTGIEIAFNHFHNCPSSAVRLEGNDILLNSNLVENCVLESDDQGAVDIYANPTYAGIEITGNVWRDIGRGGPFVPCGQAAVRFDDIISGVKVRLNRFYNCGYAHFGAVQINGGRLNVIDNNLFVNCRLDCSIGVRRPDWWKKTMTSGYAAPRIAAVKPDASPWRERYPYLSRLLEWPCMNFISRNVYVNTPRTCRVEGDNGNVTMPAEPASMPEGYDPLPDCTWP